jgi:hypothetical protein
VRQHGACEALPLLAGRGGEEEMWSGATSTTSCGSWFVGSPVLFAERCCGAPPLLLTVVVASLSKKGLLPCLPGAEDLPKELFSGGLSTASSGIPPDLTVVGQLCRCFGSVRRCPPALHAMWSVPGGCAIGRAQGLVVDLEVGEDKGPDCVLLFVSGSPL